MSKIRTAYENAANFKPESEPTFRSNRVEFTVILPNLNFKASTSEALNEALNENQKQVMDMIRKNPTIKQKELTETLGFSRSTIQRLIRDLTEQGYLKREGSKKTGSWIVND